MNIKTTGIILRAVKFRESSLILDIYTKEYGLKGFIVSGVRKKNARIPAGMLQVGNILEITAFEGSASLSRISEARLHVLFRKIARDVRRSAIYVFSLEVLKKSIQEKEYNETLFNFLKEFAIQLDSEEGNIQLYPSFFLLSLSAHLGVRPDLVEHLEYFDIRQGKSVDQIPAHMDFIQTPLSHAIFILDQLTFSTIGQAKILPREREELFETFLLYFAHHMYGFGELKSVSVIKEVLKA